MKKLFLVVASLAVLGGARNASACSCMAYPVPQEALKRSSAVFLATVAAVEVEENRGAFRQRKVTLDVERVWKGVKGTRAIVYTAIHSAACGYGFVPGGKYLVYTSTDAEGKLRTSICQRTRRAEAAGEDLKALGEGQPPVVTVETADEAKHFAEDRSYVHDLFETPAQCEEARKKFPIFNCSQWVRLSKDGGALLIVTDIANGGRYEIQGDKVIVTPRPGELGGPVVFTLAADGQSMTLDANGTVWKLRKD